MLLRVFIQETELAQSQFPTGVPVTLTDYFRHSIPRLEYLHLHDLMDKPCSEILCSSMSCVAQIATLWPQTLNVMSDYASPTMCSDPEQMIAFENKFSIMDIDGESVTYELVARVIFSSNHFTSQIRFGGKAYTYNDCVCNGHLVESNDQYLLEKHDSRSVYYVYNRTSAKSMVSVTFIINL